MKPSMRMRDVLIRLIGASDPNCPDDADVLAYYEGRLSANNRARIERHFAACDDCRRVLAFLGQKGDQPPDAITQETVSAQTNRVLTYIQDDERRQTRFANKPRSTDGFYISYSKLAAVGVVITAIAIAGAFLFTRSQSPADAAMDALRLAVRDARYSEARVSGGFDHSRYAGETRGGDRNDDDLNFSRAQSKLRGAENDNAPVNDRQALARYYLSRGARQEAKEALNILTQLAERGVETPEALNDTGVAEFQLGDYDRAIALFARALEKSPNYAEALFNLALAEERASRKDDARRDWRRFIDQTSDEKWKAEARTHISSSGPASGN